MFKKLTRDELTVMWTELYSKYTDELEQIAIKEDFVGFYNVVDKLTDIAWKFRMHHAAIEKEKQKTAN